MVQCEMCGTEVATPTTAKIEGAELQVCDSCVEFGTEVATSDASSTTTKYSTGTSSSAASQDSNSSTTPQPQSRGSSRRDMFDEMEQLASDYPDRIRDARESEDLSQEDLAQQLNEKASLIRKLERGDMQPSDAVQAKLERSLGISLTEGSDEDDTEWESDISPGSMTLGDVVKRRD